MKKLLYVVLCITAIAFASCGNKACSSDGADTLTVDTVDTVLVDTLG